MKLKEKKIPTFSFVLLVIRMKIMRGTSEMKRLGSQSWKVIKRFLPKVFLSLGEGWGGRQEVELEEILSTPRY